jgi:predicted DNA-binding transcriptional regulator AlpA
MTKPTGKTIPDFLQQERILSVRQAAELFGVSVETFRRLHWAGKLPPAIQLSERRLGWRVRDLIEHLEKSGEAA